MLKVLLVGLNSKYIHLNLAIRYLKEFCKDYNNIETCEFTINDNIGSITSEIYLRKPDIVLFSCYIWNINMILNICETLKKANPSLKIGLGGPEVSYNPEEILIENLYADFVIYGEGENTFKGLMDIIKKVKVILIESTSPIPVSITSALTLYCFKPE
jgi:radical SAM superfamily enzyme YgiQ (UPF0313 family)